MLVSPVGNDVFFLAMQKDYYILDVMGIGRCIDEHEHESRIRLHANERLHAYLPRAKEMHGNIAKRHLTMRPGKRRALDKSTHMDVILGKLEQAKARIRDKVEHPFRAIKWQFGYNKVEYRGLSKDTAQSGDAFCTEQSVAWAAGMSATRIGQRASCKSEIRLFATSKKSWIRHHLEYLASAVYAADV